jgi:hypothetical protein
MGLIAKFAWIVLPALAGCGVLSQVSSQGTGTHPGGKATLTNRSPENSAPFGAVRAQRVDVTVSFNPSKYAQEAGGRVYITYPKAPNVANQDLTVTGTIDGAPMETIKDVNGREVLGGWATSNSRNVTIRMTGTVFEREIRPGMSNPNARITQREREMFTKPNWFVQHDRPQYRAGLKAAGLEKKSGEDAFDWAVRAGDWLASNKRYARTGNASFNLEELWRFSEFNCNRTTDFLVAGARANGFPARALPVIWLKDDGTVDYHSLAEVYSEKRGWVPIEGVKFFDLRGLSAREVVGVDNMSNTAKVALAVMKDAGLDYKVPNSARTQILSGYGQCFWITGEDGRFNVPIDPRFNKTAFSIAQVALGTSSPAGQ